MIEAEGKNSHKIPFFHQSSPKTVTEQSVNFPQATLRYKPPDDQAKFNSLSPIPI